MKILSTIGWSINNILALVGKGKNDLEIGNTDSELLTSSTLTIALAGHKFSVTYVKQEQLAYTENKHCSVVNMCNIYVHGSELPFV